MQLYFNLNDMAEKPVLSLELLRLAAVTSTFLLTTSTGRSGLFFIWASSKAGKLTVELEYGIDESE